MHILDRFFNRLPGEYGSPEAQLFLAWVFQEPRYEDSAELAQ